METLVRVQLLGRPRVWIADSIVSFPFKQAEALFYYLLLEREARRDVLAELIWESSFGAEKAQSSMRNAIYVLRKQFGRGVLAEPVKNILQLDPGLRPSCDLDLLFAADELPQDYYRGEFLESFSLKKSQLYNEWVEAKRREVQSLYVKRRMAQIAQSLARRELDLCESLCEQMLALDGYDDRAYLSLIECHRLRGQYAKAAAVYEWLERLYREELFEEPSPQMRETARRLREEARSAKIGVAVRRGSAEQSALFGREREQEAIRDAVESYFSEGKPRCLTLTGEAGVGKTRLAEDVLAQLAQRRDTLVCTTACFQAEAKYALRPWQPVLRRLRECVARDAIPVDDAPAGMDTEALQYTDAEAAAAYLLGTIGKRRRLILFFDDLQWADEATISLIHRLGTDRGMPVFFVLLLQEEAVRHKYLKDFLARERCSGRMELLTLHRLGAGDTAAMARALLPEYPFTGETESQFYRETEGNPLFIVELANSMRCDGSLRDLSPNIRELIKNRIADVPPACRSLLELLSLFYSGASFELLSSISQKDDGELIDHLEYLTEHKFIREKTVEGESVYKFTHQKIPEYLYGSMSQAKKRVFHRKAGAYYEDLLRRGRGDSGLYTYLIHHYERACMRDKYLEYTIHYIHAYLGMTQEYFPVVNPSVVNTDSAGAHTPTNVQGLGMHITMEEILELLAEFTTGLGEDPAGWDERSHELISRCYHLIARYYIQSCRYEEGLKYIFKLKQINRGAGRGQLRNLLCACKQQLYIYINRFDIKGMQGALGEAFSLLPMLEDPMETAVWTRMRGMYRVMAGDIERGVEDLERAIELFRGSGSSKLFLYNLAAACAWLGEAKRYRFDSEAAAAYYREAISTCESYYWIGGVALFYTYAGMNAFDSGDRERADRYLTEAVDSYGRSSFLWGRGPALGYSALLRAEQGHCVQAAEYLSQAEQYVRMFGSRAELGCLLRIQAMLRARMEWDGRCREAFAALLADETAAYIHKARTTLRGLFCPVDSRYLCGLEQERAAR